MLGVRCARVGSRRATLVSSLSLFPFSSRFPPLSSIGALSTGEEDAMLLLVSLRAEISLLA